MSKKYTYPMSLTFEDDGSDITISTTLYRVGIYVLTSINGRMSGQENLSPNTIKRRMKVLMKSLESEGLTYSKGRDITVTEGKDGLWEEVK